MNPYRTALYTIRMWPLWLALGVVSTMGYLQWGWRGAVGLPVGIVAVCSAFLLILIYGSWVTNWLTEKADDLDRARASVARKTYRDCPCFRVGACSATCDRGIWMRETGHPDAPQTPPSTGDSENGR